jgi:undecaprenyl diphosphate synthase
MKICESEHAVILSDCPQEGQQNISFFNPEQLALLDSTRVPKHVAIIPDGNRRWAKKQHSEVETGHRHGADILMDIVKSGKELGIKMMTFYTFSTENWTRSEGEVEALLWLLQCYLNEQLKTMLDWNIRLQCIGDLSDLPEDLIKTIEEIKLATAHCDGIEMVLAVNYGSRDEICRAVKALVNDCLEKKMNPQEINEKVFSSYLDTAYWKDPDLLIRTSGELRLSNFLLWQISYTEVFVSEILWPDFRPSHLLDAIIGYQQRERRLGL